MRPSTLLGTILVGIAAPAHTAAQQSNLITCPSSIRDAADPARCVSASSVPTLGALLPLGPQLFVSPTGEVGIGTLNPACALDVAGDLRASSRVAFGNDGAFGPSPNWDWLFDLSHTISDFSTGESWAPLRSYITLDPAHDLRGPDATYLYAHDFIISTVNGNDNDIEYVQGPYMLALNEGTGTVGILAGAFLGAENNHGHVELQGGSYSISGGDWESTIVENSAGEFQSGHWGTTGSILNDYGVYVYTPYTDGAVTNHYGIYLEDQDAGLQDSYAIYSAGGTSYLAGDLGIGTDVPTAKLDVAGDFVASGTKSFVAPHRTDPTKEVRFVCLEGNEAGTYFRGKAALRGGVAVIEVPEDFAQVTDELGLTVQVTARGPGADLWVERDGLDEIVVRGASDVEFDYMVNGVRYGYAGFQTIRDKVQTASNASTRVRTPEREAARATRAARMERDEERRRQ